MINKLSAKHYLVFFAPLLTAQMCQSSFAECQDYFLNNTQLDEKTVRAYVKKHPLLVRTRNDKRQTALHLVTRYGCKHNNDPQQLVLFLLTHDANPHTVDQAGFTPLHYASGFGRFDTTCQLLVAGAKTNVQAQSHDEWIPLHCAAYFGHYDIVERLIAHDQKNHSVNLNAATIEGTTPLHFAADRKNENVALLLIKSGALVNSRTHKGLTPLHFASARGLSRAVPELLKNDANVNAEEQNGFTPLDYAASNGHLKIVCMLLNAGAHVNGTTVKKTAPAKNKNRTPLHWSVTASHQDKVILALIDAGADVNTADDKGSTPLHLLSLVRRAHSHQSRLDIHVAAQLLKNGAKTDIHDNWGWTPFYYAIRWKKFRLALLLIEMGHQSNIPEDLTSVPNQEQFIRECTIFNVIRFLPREQAYSWCHSYANQPTEHKELQVRAAKRIMEWLDSNEIRNETHLPTTLNKIIISFLIPEDAYEEFQQQPTFWQALWSIIPTSIHWSHETQAIPDDPTEAINEGQRVLALFKSKQISAKTKFPHDINLLILSFLVPTYALKKANISNCVKIK